MEMGMKDAMQLFYIQLAVNIIGGLQRCDMSWVRALDGCISAVYFFA